MKEEKTRLLSEEELSFVSGGTEWILDDSNTIQDSGGVVEYNKSEHPRGEDLSVFRLISDSTQQ